MTGPSTQHPGAAAARLARALAAVGLIAGSIVLFVAGYVMFQRQEVRA